MTAVQCAIKKKYRLREPHHMLQEWRVGCEALQYTRYQRTAEVVTEFRIQLRYFGRCVTLANYRQIRGRYWLRQVVLRSSLKPLYRHAI